MNISESQKIFMELQNKINKAEKSKQPIEHFVKQQIKILESIHDSFSKTSKSNTIQEHIAISETKIKQLYVIINLCKKIGLPTNKYEEKIRQIRIKDLGAEFVKQNFN